MTIEEQIAHVDALKERAAELSKQADEASAEFAQEQEKLWDRMDEAGVGNVKLHGRNHIPKATIFGSVNDKAAFAEWAEEHAPEMLAPRPRGGLVNEMVRQRVDNNEELPPGVTFYVRKYISR